MAAEKRGTAKFTRLMLRYFSLSSVSFVQVASREGVVVEQKVEVAFNNECLQNDDGPDIASKIDTTRRPPRLGERAATANIPGGRN
jgi:hypothetical protein